MNIPKEFTVGVRKHTVRRVRTLDRGSTDGRIYLEIGAIELATHNTAGARTAEDMEQTFWHEAMHTILRDMGHPLTRDEDFVDAVAARIHQITKTAKF